jgi:hypothetical protein
MDESFRDEFQNAEEFKRLYPGHSAPQVMCQPRLVSGFELFEIQQTIKDRAGIRRPDVTGALRGYVDGFGNETCFGWAQDLAAPEEPVCLDIFQSGQRIGQALANLYREDVRAAGFGSGYQGFEYRISENAIGGVEVRRSADGALLPPAGAHS